MDSATLRQEVSVAASETGKAQRALGFAVMEENNTEDKEKKGAIGNKIEQLKGDLEGCVSNHASAIADLRVAEGAERSAAVAKEMEEQRTQQAAIEKEAGLAKQSEEKDIDKKDGKPVVAKKDMKSGAGVDPYDRTGVDPQDIDAKQAALLKQVQEFAVKPELKDSSEAVDKDKPAVAAAAVSAAPAIAHADASSVTKDSSAAMDAPKIKAAAGTSGASA